ncbi:MAG: hypothetical protein J0I48_10565 [Devosia sp.]|uniref:hypothetical protein n=1 Tax=Devosia sp. 66-22 TaxID=1895753 RepID=UPI00092836D3|nr:hypothetical protein [Devosia sp. 66-22]MBN9346623.1 hypothetical protein [Devosia sp.]OJX54719.1 MAG: hypothetical protein BGO81_16500 [Devosia sp. 66-22]
MTRTLLLDADVIAYAAASSNEKAMELEGGYWTWHCNIDDVKEQIDDEIAALVKKFKGTSYKLCLTDSIGNFRKSVLPTYKGNRATVKKPVVLKPIRDWLIEERDAYFRPALEGDDVMGILATGTMIPGEKIIVSIDKDMKTIPGLFARGGDAKVVQITEDEANYWHLYQTLIGDTTDGYSGCPGVGPVKATAILNGVKADVAAFGGDFLPIAWAAVVLAYEKAGLTEADALVQARVARILRASDYNFKTKEPILWQPPRTPA